MKLTLKVTKKTTITLSDLGKLLGMNITAVELNHSRDYRGETCGLAQSITITSETEEAREVPQ